MGLAFCSFSVVVCLDERTVLSGLVVVFWNFVKVIHFFCKEFRCRTYLFCSVDEGVDNR